MLAYVYFFIVPSDAALALRHNTTQSQFPRSYVRIMQPILSLRSHFL
jgi:hypothetical protein